MSQIDRGLTRSKPFQRLYSQAFFHFQIRRADRSAGYRGLCNGCRGRPKSGMTNQHPRQMKTARHRRGWTQFELARRVGCSESQIAKIETGRVAPQDCLKEAIARELGIASQEVMA